MMKNPNKNGALNMRHIGFLPAAAFSIATLTTTLLTHPATAYPVDCAILLCLSGGWPASAECSYARTVFIERITPWPIEPPLQIWRCPMSISYDLRSAQPRPERIYDISFSNSPMPQILQPDGRWANTPAVPPVMRHSAVAGAYYDQRQWPGVPDISKATPQLVQQSLSADIDITGPEFDFIRSIRVFNILIDDDRTDGDCDRYERVSLGTYDSLGSFIWTRTTRNQIPAAFGPTRHGCHTRARAVFVEWRDSARNYGFERVDY